MTQNLKCLVQSLDNYFGDLFRRILLGRNGRWLFRSAIVAMFGLVGGMAYLDMGSDSRFQKPLEYLILALAFFVIIWELEDLSGNWERVKYFCDRAPLPEEPRNKRLLFFFRPTQITIITPQGRHYQHTLKWHLKALLLILLLMVITGWVIIGCWGMVKIRQIQKSHPLTPSWVVAERLSSSSSAAFYSG